MEDREAKLQALRKILEDSIAEGGHLSDDEIAAAIDAKAAELAEQGY